MERWLVWLVEKEAKGWACSQCQWSFSIPTLLNDADAKSAYDRLASAKFSEHDCASHSERKQARGQTFAERARSLVMRGFKPKDAVELVLQEITLEHSIETQDHGAGTCGC